VKNILIHKHRDKIEIRNKLGKLILDVQVANSSKTNSINLSFKALDSVSINRVDQNKNHQQA